MPETRDNTPARTYALVIGAVLTLVGIVGFLVEASFDGDDRGTLILFDVNGVHNLVHLASGLAGLMAWKAGAAASRTYALVFGLVYLLVTIWGFALGDDGEILGILPVNMEDNVLHLLIAVAGLAAYAMSKDDTRTRTTAAA
ncbi:MAG TPA: DUF4383 domain-containing protein [Solirubrobacteraceae bacterium]|nr:DUF4383 domain-containing protein [Solirubrobacteraceae bacterium]